MDTRPSPDQLLKHVQADEENAARGRLKLFFGASPGVGKTYAMLEAARQRKKQGWDVVIGLVETHGRAETQALTEGLEILARKETHYKGIILKEFDLDAALARHPRLLLVDELAHTNAAGSRHSKRWQDIEELLDAGIDIYTTLNVQHWETLNDVVAQITGVTIHETVPDSFLRRAHELELVDLAPEDLLARLKEGKVYRGEHAQHALDNFFKPGNLIALRELALRHAAERVDAQMREFKERHAIADVWHVGERILVGVSASPQSVRLIRAAGRMATRLKAEWLAVLVETPFFLKQSNRERQRAINNLRVAEKLGAETAVLSGEDVTEELLAFARRRNVTRIVLGKPSHPRWKEWLFGSIINDMARRCGNIDLQIVSGLGTPQRDFSYSEPPLKWGKEWLVAATAAVTGATLISWPLFRHLPLVNIVMLYLLGIMVVAYRFGRAASVAASVLSVLAVDFFYVPPVMTFAVSDVDYLLTFAIMLATGLVISSMTDRLRVQTQALRERAERMRALNKLSRALSQTPDITQMLETARAQLETYYGCPILILTSGPSGSVERVAGDPTAFEWNENERSVAQWVFGRSQPAGAGSETLSGAKGFYLPLNGLKSTVGVLGVRPRDPNQWADPEHLQLLESFAAEIGGALESTRMSEEIGRAEMMMETDTLHQPKNNGSFRLSVLLSPHRILIATGDVPPPEIRRLLLMRLPIQNKKAALRAVLEREKAGPTLIGSSVAIPHARMDGLAQIEAALAISPHGPVRICLLFLSPTGAPKEHLAFLAGVAAFFREEKHVAALSRLTSPDEVLSYIRQAEW